MKDREYREKLDSLLGFLGIIISKDVKCWNVMPDTKVDELPQLYRLIVGLDEIARENILKQKK